MMGPDSEMHREAFDEWLAEPGNAKAYDEARDNWTWAAAMSPSRIEADVRADAREREPGGRRWAFATILAAVIAVGFAWYLVGRDSDQPIIATNSAQGESRLADGTPRHSV
jgi:transmembrane sensor